MKYSILAAIFLTCATPAFAECNRSMFGGWKVTDRQNTRHHLLEDLSLVPVEIDDNGTRIAVIRGSWEDEISGIVYEDVNPREFLEIDHLIPISWACKHGAGTWSKEKRRTFYNDPVFLRITTSKLNGKKSDLGPDIFLPTDGQLACEYIDTFQYGIQVYELQVSVAESTLFEVNAKEECRN